MYTERKKKSLKQDFVAVQEGNRIAKPLETIQNIPPIA